MMLPGEIIKEGRFYATAVEALGAYGQGKTRGAACRNLAAIVLEIAADHRPLDGFEVSVTHDGDATLYLTANDPVRLTTMVLRCQREFNNMSLAAVMEATGMKSRNAYAQYEQGRSEPSVSKLQELLGVVAPDYVVAVIPRTAAVLPHLVRDPEEEAAIAAALRDPSPENLRAFIELGRKGKKRKAG